MRPFGQSKLTTFKFCMIDTCEDHNGKRKIRYLFRKCFRHAEVVFGRFKYRIARISPVEFRISRDTSETREVTHLLTGQRGTHHFSSLNHLRHTREGHTSKHPIGYQCYYTFILCILLTNVSCRSHIDTEPCRKSLLYKLFSSK